MGFGIAIAVIIGLTLLLRFFIIPASSPRPTNLGWRGAEEGWRNCPDAMNCVSSTAEQDTRFYIEPIPFTGTVESANSAIIEAINAMPRSEVISNNSNYIHAEFTSFTMGYIDDTEFYIDTDNNVIQVRSGARLGYGDAGVNRKIIETIRAQFEG